MIDQIDGYILPFAYKAVQGRTLRYMAWWCGDSLEALKGRTSDCGGLQRETAYIIAHDKPQNAPKETD